jgi:hypothetical protein
MNTRGEGNTGIAGPRFRVSEPVNDASVTDGVVPHVSGLSVVARAASD